MGKWDSVMLDLLAYLDDQTYERLYTFIGYAIYAAPVVVFLVVPFPIFISLCTLAFYIQQHLQLDHIIQYIDGKIDSFKREQLVILQRDTKCPPTHQVDIDNSYQDLAYLVILSKPVGVRTLILRYALINYFNRWGFLSKEDFIAGACMFTEKLYDEALGRGLYPILLKDDMVATVSRMISEWPTRYTYGPENKPRNPFMYSGVASIYSLYAAYFTKYVEMRNKAAAEVHEICHDKCKKIYYKIIEYYKLRIYYKSDVRQVILSVQSNILEHIYWVHELHHGVLAPIAEIKEAIHTCINVPKVRNNYPYDMNEKMAQLMMI